jgi:amino acid transporter
MTSIGGKEALSQAVASGKPIPHVLFAVRAFGTPGLMIMMLMSLVASITCFNAGLLTASRFLYAMARDHAAPKILSKIHDKYMTPHIAIWVLFAVCAGISILVAYSGVVKPFIYMGAFAECLIYVAMAISLIRLRKTQPEQPRPYRVKTLFIPIFVAVFFFVLGIGILLDNSIAAMSMGIGAVLVSIYVKWIVPQIKKSGLEQAQAPKRRRPGGSTSEPTELN